MTPTVSTCPTPDRSRAAPTASRVLRCRCSTRSASYLLNTCFHRIHSKARGTGQCDVLGSVRRVRRPCAAGFVLLQCRMCGKRLRVCEGTVTDLSTLSSVGRSLTHMPTQQQNTAAITTRWFWWVTCIQRRSRRAAWKDRLLGSYSCFNPTRMIC